MSNTLRPLATSAALGAAPGTTRPTGSDPTDGDPTDGDPTGGRDARIRRRVVAGVVLLVVAAGMLGLRVLTSDAVTLPALAQDFATLAVSVILESFPFIVLGIVLAVLVQVWLPDGFLLRVMPRSPMLRRAALSLLGVFLPVCECGNVPLSRTLVIKGFTVSESLTFLLAAPILNPVTIITTWQAFGGDPGILVARLIGGFVIANLVGWIFSRHPDSMQLLTPDFRAECELQRGAARNHRWRRSFEQVAHELSELMPALLLGAGVAAFIQVVVPRDVLVTLGGHPVLSVLALMALAFVVSLCANVDAFFVLALGSTFLPGAVVAFLVFGPMIDIKMLALMRTTFTAKALALITIAVASLVLLLGLAVNQIA